MSAWGGGGWGETPWGGGIYTPSSASYRELDGAMTDGGTPPTEQSWASKIDAILAPLDRDIHGYRPADGVELVTETFLAPIGVGHGAGSAPRLGWSGGRPYPILLDDRGAIVAQGSGDAAVGRLATYMAGRSSRGDLASALRDVLVTALTEGRALSVRIAPSTPNKPTAANLLVMAELARKMLVLDAMNRGATQAEWASVAEANDLVNGWERQRQVLALVAVAREPRQQPEHPVLVAADQCRERRLAAGQGAGDQRSVVVLREWLQGIHEALGRASGPVLPG